MKFTKFGNRLFGFLLKILVSVYGKSTVSRFLRYSGDLMMLRQRGQVSDLITEILETNGIRKEVILLKDGQEAIDYFQEGYVNAVEGVQDEVGLIILDLKLPKA